MPALHRGGGAVSLLFPGGVGSPQQEKIARLLELRQRARGLALCVGGAINFLTGGERRAPQWMQTVGMEWLHRLLVDPRRMAKRYLVRGPRIFWLLPKFRWELRATDTGRCRPLVSEAPEAQGAARVILGD